MTDYPYQSWPNLAVIAAAKGLFNVVVSPGSRCAPLTISFHRHGGFSLYKIPDERSAAFIGLGLSIESQMPSLLVCTSGTAALNYGPALAEALYQHIPLIALTADRPPEWIDQQDGQAIRQFEIHKNYVKKSFQLMPEHHPEALWYNNRLFNEAINLALEAPYGPVHVNVPIREPFYPEKDQPIHFPERIRVIENEKGHLSLSEEQINHLTKALKTEGRVLVIAGQYFLPEEQKEKWSKLLDNFPFTLVSDTISNLQFQGDTLVYQDFIFKHAVPAKVDILITFGLSVLSKPLKLWLRDHPPKEHWQVQEAGDAADTFQHLTKIIRAEPLDFLMQISQPFGRNEKEICELNAKNQLVHSVMEKFFNRHFFGDFIFSEVGIVAHFLGQLPEKSVLHLANSMAVRYVNLVGISGRNIDIRANRGTSGIDGSNSTAVGAALASPSKSHFLLTGDLSFFYDRNAFWHNTLPQNLKIVLINNGGGVIFRMIDGPRKQAELEAFFETEQRLSAPFLAAESKMAYFEASDVITFQQELPLFLKEEGIAILELFTNKEVAYESLQQLHSFISAAFAEANNRTSG